MPTLIDLTTPLENRALSEPTFAPEFESPPRIEYFSHARGAEECESLFGCSRDELPNGLGWSVEVVHAIVHTATHCDSPRHYSPVTDGGKTRSMTIDEVPLDWYYGPGVILDMTHKGSEEPMEPDDVQQALDKIDYEVKENDIVLFRTDGSASSATTRTSRSSPTWTRCRVRTASRSRRFRSRSRARAARGAAPWRSSTTMSDASGDRFWARPGEGGTAPAVASFSQGVRVGQLVFTAGQASIDADANVVGAGDIRAQTEQTLRNLRAALEACGASIRDVVKMTIWLRDFEDYAGMNEIYGSWFEPPEPVRACVRPELVFPGLLVEMEAVAVVDGG